MSNTIRDLVSEIQFVHKKEKWTIAHVAKSVGKTRVTLQRAMKNPEEEASKAIKALLIEKHGGVIQNVSRGNSLNNPLPLGNLVVTLGDYVDLIKQQRDSYQKIIESGLVKIQDEVIQSRDNSVLMASTIEEQLGRLLTLFEKYQIVPGAAPPLKEDKIEGKQQGKHVNQGNHGGGGKSDKRD